VAESVALPLAYWRANVAGTLALLEALNGTTVRSLVFSSTCATYGTPEALPLREDHPQHPINPYGATKLAIERLLADQEPQTGIRWAALRYFNAAGAHPDGTIGEDHAPEIHLIPLAFQAATGGTPLKVFGQDYPTPDGTCQRDYIHVCDLAEAHLCALAALERGAPSSAYNIGTGLPHSVRAVIDTVSRVTGTPVAWEAAPRRPGDPAALFAASDRARSELHWTPRYADLETIVRHAWQWHSTHPRGYAVSDAG
jgi:UDP-glucose-4-epimerase GalE